MTEKLRLSVKMEAKLFLFAFFTILVIVDGAITSPEDIEVCVGKDVTIPWNYDDADNTIGSVIWTVNTTTDIMTYFGSGGPRNPQNGYNVIAANNFGSITITNAQRSNTGIYQIEVTTSTTISDQVDLLVCELQSTIVGGTITNSVVQCTASDLGEPEAQLYVKVNGEAKSSSSASVKESDKVECCISGCAAKCFGGSNEYCKTVQSCKENCKKRVIASIVFGILGMIALVVVIIGIVKDFSKPVCLTAAVLCIVFDIISLGLSASVLADDDCKDCPDWIHNSAIAFVVIPSIVAVTAIVLTILVLLGVIGQGGNANEAYQPGENREMPVRTQ